MNPVLVQSGSSGTRTGPVCPASPPAGRRLDCELNRVLQDRRVFIHVFITSEEDNQDLICSWTEFYYETEASAGGQTDEEDRQMKRTWRHGAVESDTCALWLCCWSPCARCAAEPPGCEYPTTPNSIQETFNLTQSAGDAQSAERCCNKIQTESSLKWDVF